MSIAGCSKSDSYSSEEDIERLMYSTIDGVKTKIYWLGEDQSTNMESYMVLDINNSEIRYKCFKIKDNGGIFSSSGESKYSNFYIDDNFINVYFDGKVNSYVGVTKYKFINSKKVKFYIGDDYEHVFTCRPVAGSPDWSQYE